MRDPSMNSDYSYPLVTTCMGRFLGWDVSYVLDNNFHYKFEANLPMFLTMLAIPSI